MPHSALRSLLLLVLAVAVSVAANRPLWSECSACCAIVPTQASAAETGKEPPCCAQHQPEACPVPAPVRPCGPCCRPSEPLAKAESPRREIDESVCKLRAAIVVDATAPDARLSGSALDGVSRLHSSDPPLRVLLCNWRN